MADAPTAEQLLHDIAWLRGLARTLASDRDDADDLAQDAVIAAWKRQPDGAQPMRGWLTKVARDLAAMKRRGDRRREARHAHADEPQAVAGPDELLAQMRLHKRLVELVIELDEPYRSTVIARFVEGRTSASIAQSLGIPAGTVRKRLHEALSRLRAGLDASAGERKRWAPAALAFAKGGMVVAKSTKLALIIVAMLLVAAVVMFVRSAGGGGGGGTTTSMHTPEPTAPGAAAPSAPRVTAAGTDARAPRAPVAGPRAAERASMLAAIARAREARGRRGALPLPTLATPGAPTSMGSDAPGTTLNLTDRTGDTSDWSKRALGTLNKLLGQCYDLGRAEDPNLEGTVVVQFTLVGEPKVGGLLESVEIVDAETTLSQQTLRDCVTQQLYALELDPPPDGVKVQRQITLKVP